MGRQTKGCTDVVWRYSGNPILDWNPIPKAARIFNSAVLPYEGEFVWRVSEPIKGTVEQLSSWEEVGTP